MMCGSYRRAACLAVSIAALIALILAAGALRDRLDIPAFGPRREVAAAPKQRPLAFRRNRAALRNANLNLVGRPTVAINEVCAGGVPAFRDGAHQPHDWVEFYNNTDQPVNMAGWFLSDARRRPRKWTFPDAVVQPRGHLLVWLSGGGPEGEIHADFRLANTGDFLALYDPAGRPEDYVALPAVPPGATYARTRDGDGPFAAAAPTPLGRPFAGEAVVDPPSGAYTAPLNVPIPAVEAGVTIRYTLDGSDPEESSPVFDKALAITGNSVLKARLFAEGRWPGPITTRFYWLEPLPPAGLISLVVDPDDLKSKEHGIIRNAWAKGGDWERPAWVSFIEPDGLAFEGPAGIRVHGKSTRRYPKKSFKLHFRDRYGLPECDYDFFEPGSGRRLSKIIVKGCPELVEYDEWRRGIMDTSLLSGPIGYAMMQRCGVDAPRTRYVVITLNGGVYGIGYLAEDIGERYLESRCGHADFDLVKFASGSPLAVGTIHNYNRLMARLEDLLGGEEDDPEAVLRAARGQMDLDSLTRWVIVTCFTQVRDHMQGVYALNKRDPEARWRMMAWDMDHAFRRGTRYPAGIETWQFDKLAEFRNFRQDVRGRLIRELLRTDDYRSAYLERLQELVNHCLRADIWLPELEARAGILARIIPYEERAGHRGGGYPPDLDRAARLAAVTEAIREFLENKPEHILRQTAERYERDLARLNLRVEGEGAIAVNGHPERDGFSGLCFSGTALRLEARPATGWRFSHWTRAGSESRRPAVDHDVQADATVAAVFIRKEPT